MATRSDRVPAAGRLRAGVRRPADRSRGRADRGRRRDRRRRPGRPRLRDPADAAAGRGRGADGVARRGAGGARGEGQGPGLAPAVGGDDEPVGDARAVPGPATRATGRRTGRSTRTRSTCCPNRKRAIPLQADPAAVPQPRQPRDLGRAAGPLAVRSRPRRPASTSSARPRGYKLLVEDGQVVGVRSGDKGRGRDGQELSNFEPGSDLIAKATVLAEGTAGPPDRRGDPPLRHRLRGPAAVGARREGDLGGPEAARPRDPHDGLAAQVRREVPRVRRLVHLPDGRGQGLDGPRGRARLPRRALLGARRASRS